MLPSLNSAIASLPLLEDRLEVIRRNLARAMVGSTVDLLADGRTITHGIVTRVKIVAGMPKIIVKGRPYDLDQVVTAVTT
jgi:hypothetical protein